MDIIPVCSGGPAGVRAACGASLRQPRFSYRNGTAVLEQFLPFLNGWCFCRVPEQFDVFCSGTVYFNGFQAPWPHLHSQNGGRPRASSVKGFSCMPMSMLYSAVFLLKCGIIGTL